MNLQVRKNRLSAFRASSVFPSFFAWLAQVANLPLRIVHYCLHFCPFFCVLIDNFMQLVRSNKGALLLNPRQPLLHRWSKEAEFCSKQPSFWTLSSLSSCEKEEEWSSCEKEEEWQWRNCCSWSWVGCKASRPLCATKDAAIWRPLCERKLSRLQYLHASSCWLLVLLWYLSNNQGNFGICMSCWFYLPKVQLTRKSKLRANWSRFYCHYSLDDLPNMLFLWVRKK